MGQERTMLMKILFIVYLIFLVWAVLFKFNLSLSDVRSVREVNWIPFYYENVEKGDIPLLEALMNLLIFIPLWLFTGTRMQKKLLENDAVYRSGKCRV